MDHKSDDDSDGLQCKNLKSHPWSEPPPQLSVIYFRTTQADQALIDNEQHTSSSNVSSSIPTPVHTHLIMSMCRSLDAKLRSFLPQSCIDTITPHLVKGELNKTMPTLSESVLDNYAAQILGVASNNATGQERSFHKLSLESRLVKTFAILVLIGKVETIPSFLASGFTDSLLPIAGVHIHGEGAWRCFDKWTISSIEAFIETQWVVLSPFLSAPKTDVSLYNFPAQIILPILEDDPATTLPVRFGGYSAVRKVRIHHRHHDFGENQDNPYFALKKLRSQHIEDFQREVAALRPFVVSPHLHIVKLLAAFRHDDSFYLLFPWAEAGSLHTFWKDNPRPVPTASLSRWISEQCLGIATALGQIHHGPDSLRTDSSSYCGRHGDIKPSNILLFQKDPDKNPVLTLSDFGLGKLNHHTKKRGDRPVGFSPTYRAPELDLKGEINSAYDIWSLGCVFLELLTWVSRGWEGFQSFALSRVDVDQRFSKVGERDDGFFSITARQGGLPDARLKKGVSLWVNNLSTEKTLSPYIRDFTNFTLNDLLDTNWETRATISRVVEKLQCLRQRCLEDPTYTVAIPRPRKPPWPPQKLASLYQDNSSTLKSQTQPTSFNMDQLTSSNGLNLPDSMTMPHQDGYWPNFDGQHYGIINASEMFNFTQNNVMSMEGVSGSRQFGALSHPRIHAKRQIPPEQNAHGSPTSRRRTSDNMTGYRNTIDEPKKKKVRKKGGTATRSPSKDKSPKISEQDPFQAPSCEVAESSGPTAEGKMFACPFYKQNPEKYNTKAWKACAVPEGRTIPRLKEHIYRNHCSDRQRCDRCFAEFEKISDLQRHCRLEMRCPIRDAHTDIDTIDEAQKHEMQKKQRGISEEEKWKKIYRIIFRLDPTSEVPSPYCDATEIQSSAGGDNQNDTGTVAEFEAFLHRRLADDGNQDASQINGCLDLVKRFQQERMQEQSVAAMLSEIPSLTFDYPDNTARTFESPDCPTSTLATVDDSVPSIDFSTAGTDDPPAPPLWDDSFTAHFDKVFSSDKPYSFPNSFPDSFSLEDEGGRLPGG